MQGSLLLQVSSSHSLVWTPSMFIKAEICVCVIQRITCSW